MSKKHILAAVILTITGIVIGFGLDYYIVHKKNNVSEEKVIYIYKDYSYSQMIDTICLSGALKNSKSFVKAAKRKELKNKFKAGRYSLKKGMGNNQIIATIAFAWQSPMQLTFRGYSSSVESLAYVFGKRFEADSAEFIQYLGDTKISDSLGFDRANFIGMFIPNTYEFYWTASPMEVISRFKREYDTFWTDERKAKAKSISISPQEVITLASIVVSESNYAPEQPRIAGVYINRLKKGIKLQADPTVRFVAIQKEPDLKRILHRHLKINSPYNTYIHRGLPPGPIIIPSMSAINAVLNYEKNSYIYFCAKPTFDGTHNFTSSYSKHLENARAYSKALNKRLKEQAMQNTNM